jgi:hypothetical protein
MAYKMNDLPGIAESHAAKLRELSVENTDDLLRLWGDGPKRPALIERTGIAKEDMLNLVAMARLARIKGVSLQNIEMLVAAGVDGRRRLHEYTPESLVKHLGEVTLEKKLTGPVPSLDEVTPWFVETKPAAVHAK